MTKIDLITGFLGSGKTTFIKMYAQFLIEKGENIGILENDYGAVNVDMMLLSDLQGDNCELEMVASACHNDCHQRRFKAKLISMAMMGYDRVIVEPSGIYDIDEFFDSLRDEPLNRMYSIDNIITIVDARLEDNLSPQSEYYLASEIATSGIVLLSRSQLVDAFVCDSVKAHISRSLESAKVNRTRPLKIMDGNWFDFNESDFESIYSCGHDLASYEKKYISDSTSFSSVYLLDIPMTTDFVKEKISSLFNSSEYGHIFRIKGFYKEDSVWYEINATQRDIEIKPISLGQQVLIIIGEDLDETSIENLFN